MCLRRDKEYTERNLYKSSFHLPLAFNCARQFVLRAKYMRDAEHQRVASEIMSFSRVLETPGRLLQKLFPWISTTRTRISPRNQGTLG